MTDLLSMHVHNNEKPGKGSVLPNSINRSSAALLFGIYIFSLVCVTVCVCVYARARVCMCARACVHVCWIHCCATSLWCILGNANAHATDVSAGD